MNHFVKYILVSLGSSSVGFLAGSYLFPHKTTKYIKISKPDPVDPSEISLYNAIYVVFRHIIEIRDIPSLQTREFKNFAINYDRRHRVPKYIIERLSTQTLDKISNFDVLRNSLRIFQEDSTIPNVFRSQNVDFNTGNYTRGHMAAAANHVSDLEEYKSTYLLSNIAPQSFSLNSQIWNLLENHVRDLTKRSKSVYVCTGPLYIPTEQRNSPQKIMQYEVLGLNNVAVPTHFFKYIRAQSHEQHYHIEAYIMPNQDYNNESQDLMSYQVSPAEIERNAGFLFMEDVYIQNNVLTVNNFY